MNYRTLGRTGLSVSEIGFGCGNVGGLMVSGGHEEQLQAVRRALELGINYFDTAAAYGDGKSEIHLGRVLKKVGSEITLATKIRLGPEALSDLKAATIASVEAGLERLQRNSADLIQLHTRVALKRGGGRFLLTPAEVLGPAGVIEGFKSLRDKGRVRFFGFSGLGEPDVLHLLIDSGEFHSVQVYYNLLNPSSGHPVPKDFSAANYGGLMNRAAAKGMGAVVIRVVAAGALTGRPEAGGGKGRGEALSLGSDYAIDVERASHLGFLTDGDIKSLGQAAIRFALMKPEVSTVLVGFSDMEQIQEAADCSGAGGLSEDNITRLKRLWGTDFGRL